MRRALVIALAAWVGACHVASPPAVSPRAASSRVIMISYDGISADEFDRLLQSRDLREDGLKRLAAVGTHARVIPVNPTLTASAHISIATGATPQQTGIVSNRFHLPGTPRTESISGFDAPIDVDTLWEAARRQGKRVGVITFPGVDGKGVRRTADWGLAFSHPIARSKMIRLQRSDFTADPTADLSSFSTVFRTPLRWEFSLDERFIGHDVNLFVIDTTDDQIENYDAVRIRIGETHITPDSKRWFPISLEHFSDDGRHLYGSWSKVLRLHPQLREVVIYWGPITTTIGYPASYREMIDREIGFWPGPPDEMSAAKWMENGQGIDPDTFVEQMNRLGGFLTTATTLSIRRMPWDFILAYNPSIDEAEHQFRILNQRQQWYSAENREIGRRVRAAAYARVDEAVANILSMAPSDTAVVVTGDHGLAEVDTLVRVNRLLADWGFVEQKEGKVSSATPWISIHAASLAHIYQFEGTERERSEVIRRLREARSPDGEPVFEQVETKGPEHHRNSGDVIAYAYPRFALSSNLDGPAFEKTEFFGQHGGLNHHPDYHTLLLAAGVSVPRSRGATISQTEIAAFVSQLLDIEPPAQAAPRSVQLSSFPSPK